MFTCLSMLCLAQLVGCEEAKHFEYDLRDSEGTATLTLESHITIRFEGILIGDEPDTGTFQVGGPGGDLWRSGDGEYEFHYDYAYNHATISVGDHQIQVTKFGKELTIGDSVFDIENVSASNPLVIVVDASGKVSSDTNVDSDANSDAESENENDA